MPMPIPPPIPPLDTDSLGVFDGFVRVLRAGCVEREVDVERFRLAVDVLRANGWTYWRLFERANAIDPGLGRAEFDSLMEDA